MISYSLKRCIKKSLKSFIHSEPKKNVAIVGGGVAGLQALRSLKAAGHNVTVFERANDIGGVWRENYANMAVQVPRELYEIPDYEMKAVPSNDFAKSAEVQKYIKDFTIQMKLVDNIILNTSVEKVKQTNYGWDISYNTEGREKTVSYDYLIISTGMYSSHLNIPKYSGYENFIKSGGEILHSSQCNLQKIESLQGKHVVTIGSAKSAEDVAAAVLTSGKATSSSLLFRRAHWGTPIFIAGIIPFQYVFLSRFGQALVSMYKGVWPGTSSIQEVIHKILAPVMYPIFKIVETLFAFQLNQYGVWKPELDVVTDFYGYGHLPTNTFLSCLKSGDIKLIKDDVKSLNSDRTVTLQSGSTIPCDILILGTGFKKSYDMFEHSVQEALDVQTDGLYLYRHMIPANVPNLAFIGSEIATISNIATHHIQSQWLVQVLSGDIKLPTQSEMTSDISRMKVWKRSWMPETPSRASLALLHQIHYHDSLLKDMGQNPHRKGFVLSEMFSPYRPVDYKAISA